MVDKIKQLKPKKYILIFINCNHFPQNYSTTKLNDIHTLLYTILTKKING